MTEPESAAVYSKDYWDLVLGQLRKRPSARVALVALALLYAVAIFAPFVANDRPLLFVGTDYDAYRSAHRLVRIVAEELVGKAQAGREGFEAARRAEQERGRTVEGSAKTSWEEKRAAAPSSFRELLERQERALAFRLEAMRRQLPELYHPMLDEVHEHARTVVDAAIASDETALAAAGEALVGAAERVRSELRAARPGREPEPGRTVALVPYRAYPALEGVSTVEAYFMAFWVVVLAWPLWSSLLVNRVLLGGDRERIRRVRRRKLAVVLVVPVLAAAGWWLAGSQTGSERLVSGFKTGLSSGVVEAETVVFPPVPFGMAEQNKTEFFRPPTWHGSAAISEEGYYESGSRAVRVDEVTGTSLMATPVEVRAGEPERNDPLRHPLGTDSLGRDLLARMVWGGRVSLQVGLTSTLVLLLVGTFVGSLAGYFGGAVDLVLSRIIEIVQCVPVFFLILIVVAFIGPSITNIVLAIGLFRWTGVARLVRGEFIRLRSQDFVVASEALGASSGRTIFRHVLPNAMGPVLVAATFSVAAGILTESALSYLGFGVQLPIPSWGSLLIESKSTEHWWIQVFPGIAIFVTVILYNLLGEGVRDALDPRLKEG